MCYYALALSANCYAGCYFGLIFGIVCRDVIMAQNLINAAIMILNFGAGLLANTGTGANWLIRFISWISPVRYGAELVMRRVLAGEPSWFADPALTYLGYTLGTPKCVCILLGMIAFMFLVGWIAICYQFKKF